MKGFDPSKLITNPNELFGREEILRQLTTHVVRKNIVQLIGLRRYGKTSILKCLEQIIAKDFSDKIFAFYFDFKEEGASIRGTSNVYRYLISRICQRLTLENIIDSEIEIKNVKLKPYLEWEDCYEHLESVSNVRIQGLFKEVVCWFSEYSGRTFYFFFDEYEYLFRFTFDSPIGFMAMRSLSSQPLKNGQIPFGFIISGTLTFEKLCTLTGSGELNVVSETLYVRPIKPEEFEDMWNFECSRISNENIDIAKKISFFYSASGGVPFYGKLLAESWIISEAKPDYLKLKSFFEEIIQTLPIKEQKILNQLCFSESKLNGSIHKDELVRKGLIQKLSSKKYAIKSDFFRHYLFSKTENTLNENDLESKIPLKASIINKLISTINNTCKNKGKSYIFEPTIDDAALILDLQKPCPTAESFCEFANSLYKIVFERTKGNSRGNRGGLTLGKIPLNHKKNNKFIEIVDIMRHSLGGAHLMDRFNPRSGQMSKSDMLVRLTGSKNEPFKPEDFIKIQFATLDLFEKDLRALIQIVKK